LTVQYDRVLYLLEDSPVTRALIDHYLDVYEYPDGRIEIVANGVALTYRQHDRLSMMDQALRWITNALSTCWRSRARCRWSVTTGAFPARHRGPIGVNR